MNTWDEDTITALLNLDYNFSMYTLDSVESPPPNHREFATWLEGVTRE